MEKIVKTKVLMEDVRSKINELETVQECLIYGGEFSESDFDYFKGSVEFGTTCLLTAFGGLPEQSRNKRTIQTNVDFNVFIIGTNDIDDDNKIAHSEACMDTIDELTELLINNSFDTNIMFSSLGQWLEVENTIDKDKRVSIYVFPFSLTYKTNLTKNIQLN